MNTLSFFAAFAVISTLLFGYYFLFLRKENRFQSNRFFLLGILPISAILPFIKLNVFPLEELSPAVSTTLETITISGEKLSTWAYGYEEITTILYLGISLLILTTLFLKLAKIFLFIQKSPIREKYKGATILYRKNADKKEIAPATFGKYIFFNQLNTHSQQEKEHILAHELCHVRQLHSLDILFLELCKVIFWIHPLVYLISRELRIIHEYQADRAASQQGEQHSYIELLLSQALGQPLQLTHTFFQLPLKNRIMMLTLKPNSTWSAVKYTLLIPFLFFVFVACTADLEKEVKALAPENSFEQEANSGPATIIIETHTEENTFNHSDVSEKPKPTNLMDIKRQIGYPQICRDANIEGKVILKVLVDKAGNYKEHQVVEEGHEILRKEVEKYISKLSFTPAQHEGKAVEFWVNMPFNFKLKD